MFFLLQVGVDAFDAAEKINPYTPIVWGLLTVAGWGLYLWTLRQANEERKQNKEDTKEVLQLMTKVEIHLASQSETLAILREIRDTVEYLRRKTNE